MTRRARFWGASVEYGLREPGNGPLEFMARNGDRSHYPQFPHTSTEGRHINLQVPVHHTNIPAGAVARVSRQPGPAERALRLLAGDFQLAVEETRQRMKRNAVGRGC